MSNLDKFYSMFSDLDLSYKTMSGKLGNPSKLEFLKRIYFTDKGNPITPKVKDALSKEFDYYDSVDREKYTTLIEILDSLELFFGSNPTEEVISLNAVVLKSITDRSDLFVDKKISKDDVIKISSSDYYNDVKYMTSQELFENYGEILSFSKYYRGKPIVRLLKEDYLNKFLVVEPKTINELVKHVSENNLISSIVDLYPKYFKEYDVLAFCDITFYVEGKLLGRQVKVLDEVHNRFTLVSYEGNVIVVTRSLQ